MNGARHDKLLFQPIRIGQLELAGRFAKSAYIETMCTEDGFVTDQLIEHYEEIARGGTPLLMTSAIYFNQYSQAMTRGLALDHDDKIPGLQRLTARVQQYGAKIFAQIYHAGRQAVPSEVGRQDAQAPSPQFEPVVGCKPRAMSIDEIRETVRLFGVAAERAKRAGFDGVQIHAAHGYLINAFLTPHTNRRKDEYGGSAENRMRFLVEVYRAVRAQVGPDFPVILKLNGHDDLPLRKGLITTDYVQIARHMQDEGIDAVEVTAGHYESGLTFERGHWKGFFSTLASPHGIGRKWPTAKRLLISLLAPVLDAYLNRVSAFRPAFNLPYARAFKQALDIPIICVGGFADQATIEDALNSAGCDMVAVARPIIADPHMYNHMKAGVTGPRCDFCQGCYARATALPTDCYNPHVKAEQMRMLQAESQWGESDSRSKASA